MNGQIASSAVVNFFHVHDWKIMSQTVVAEVIAKGTFGHLFVWVDRTHDTKIGIGINRRAVSVAYHGNPMTGQSSGKRQFAHSFWQRHHSRNGHRRITADKDVYSKRFAGLYCGSMMHADSAMDLVVHPDTVDRFRTRYPKAEHDTCPYSIC